VRVEELDLGARVAAVAELVLEALDLDRVLAAVGVPARHEEARRAAVGRARDDQVRVAHRRREEPLVAADRVRPPRPPPSSGVAAVVLARTSEPPCFSVMPMPT
jgi:hypothetical protein